MRFSKLVFGNAIAKFLNKRNGSGGEGLGELGSGAGKGGGGGGTVREAGGSMGKYGAVKEEEYFYKKQREQLEALKKSLQEENACHQKEIEKLQKSISKNNKVLEEIDQCYKT